MSTLQRQCRTGSLAVCWALATVGVSVAANYSDSTKVNLLRKVDLDTGVNLVAVEWAEVSGGTTAGGASDGIDRAHWYSPAIYWSAGDDHATASYRMTLPESAHVGSLYYYISDGGIQELPQFYRVRASTTGFDDLTTVVDWTAFTVSSGTITFDVNARYLSLDMKGHSEGNMSRFGEIEARAASGASISTVAGHNLFSERSTATLLSHSANWPWDPPSAAIDLSVGYGLRTPNAADCWFIVDLGSEYSLAAVGLGLTGSFPTGTKLEVSLDNSTWDTAHTWSATVYNQILKFANPVMARYVKLDIPNPGGHMTLSEFELYAAPTLQAVSQSVSASAGVSLAITLEARNPDGNPLTWLIGNPSHGVVSGTGPNVSYTANSSYEGIDSFTFRVTDGPVTSSVATVSITVSPNYDAWTRSMPITFAYPHTEPLSDFPVLVKLSQSIPGFVYSDVQSPDGWDLRFLNAAKTAVLPYEIERWNPSGESSVWVKLDVLTNNVTIHARWGNAAATDQKAYTTNGAVWNVGYRAVWHLNETEGTAVRDSTQNGVHGTAYGGPTFMAAGPANGAHDYDGSNDHVIFVDAEDPYDYTLEMWVKPQATSTRSLFYRTDATATGGNALSHQLRLRADGKFENYFWDGSNMRTVEGTTVASADTWYHVAARVKGGDSQQIFVDGIEENSASPVGPPWTGGDRWYMASHFIPTWGWNAHQGCLDEVRLSRVPRSANWLWATYQNINPATHAVFSEYGPVEALGRPRGTAVFVR